MKICIVIKRLSQSWGGAERVAVNLCKKLYEKSHEVHVITAASDVQINGVKINIIKVNRLFSALKILSFQKGFERILKEKKFDIVYGLCQVYPVDIYRVGGGVHGYWMRLLYPHPAVRWLKYLTSPVHLAMVMVERRIFKEGGCRLFITNSRLIKDQVMKYFHIPEERIRVVYNGVDHEIFNPGVKRHRSAARESLLIDSDDLVLLFAANNWERKGLATIIEAAQKTGLEKIKIVVAGRGKQSPYLSLAAQAGLARKIIFTGPVTDIDKYYGMADVFILPARYEPFSNVCLEAMACGLPVITTKNNGASEIITENSNGFVLNDWRDAESLSGFIKILSSSAERRRMGESSAMTARGYTWERHIEETDRVFGLAAAPHS